MRPSLICAEKYYPSPNVCIYCLENDIELTDEHIITFSIGGRKVLRNASCKKCAEYINETYEQPTLNGVLLAPRLLLELKRRKSKQKRNLKLVGLDGVKVNDVGDEGFDTQLEPFQYSPLCQLPFWEPAGKLIDADKSSGVDKFRLFHIHLGTTFQSPFDKVVTRHPINQKEFALALAKSAYSYAVAKHGLENFDGAEMRDLLLGKRNDVFNFVGGPLREEKLTDRYFHNLYERREGQLCTVLVHMFASYKMKPYQVVVGRFS